MADLWINDPIVPGAFRTPEKIIPLTVSGNALTEDAEQTGNGFPPSPNVLTGNLTCQNPHNYHILIIANIISIIGRSLAHSAQYQPPFSGNPSDDIALAVP